MYSLVVGVGIEIMTVPSNLNLLPINASNSIQQQLPAFRSQIFEYDTRNEWTHTAQVGHQVVYWAFHVRLVSETH